MSRPRSEGASSTRGTAAGRAGHFPTVRSEGLTARDFERSIAEKLYYAIGRFPAVATRNDQYLALAYAVRDRLLERWVRTAADLRPREQPHGLLSLGRVPARAAPRQQPASTSGSTEPARAGDGASSASTSTQLLEQEEEPGLGNGGLGRLAACYLDSLATLEIPAIGYGIRYEFGIFDQAIRDGWQVEIDRQVAAARQPLGDRAARDRLRRRLRRPHRAPWTDARGGYRVALGAGAGGARASPTTRRSSATASTPRTCCACGAREAAESFDFQAFNVGRLLRRRSRRRSASETITKVLYPNDATARRQAAAARAAVLLRLLLAAGHDPHLPAERAGTSSGFDRQVRGPAQRHPPGARRGRADAAAGRRARPGLGRGLGDHHAAPSRYTNHTLLPEALEKWPLPLFGALLPRHLEIVYEINRRFLDEVRAALPGRRGRVQRLSLIDEAGAALRAHGEPRLRRQPRRQRRRRAAHRAAAATSCCATSTSCGRRSSAT